MEKESTQSRPIRRRCHPQGEEPIRSEIGIAAPPRSVLPFYEPRILRDDGKKEEEWRQRAAVDGADSAQYYGEQDQPQHHELQPACGN